MDATKSTTNALNALPQVRVVPMVPGMRTRKRSSNMSGSSTVGSTNTVGENDDMDSITDNDSMRPLADYTVRRSSRSHKRQRRTILDAFNSISLKGPLTATSATIPTTNMTTTSDTSISNSSDRLYSSSALQLGGNRRNDQAVLSSVPGNNYLHQYPQLPQHHQQQPQHHEHLLSLHHSSNDNHHNQQQYNDDADSSRAVAEDNEHNEGGYTTSSSLEDEFDDDDDDDDEIAYNGGTAQMDEQMLSDRELIQKNAERKVMLELVFGPESTFMPPKDPVDRKLHRLINHTLKRAARNSVTQTASATTMGVQPDTMDITADTTQFMNPINGIVVQTNECPDDVSLATTTGGYNSTVSSDSGGANTNTNSDLCSIHSLQTDAAVGSSSSGGGRRNGKGMGRTKTIRFLFQRSNSLPDNLFHGTNPVTNTIDTVTEEMDTTEQI